MASITDREVQLQLRMTLESNKLARHMLDVHLEVSKSSETTADLARIAQAVTEDKSREGRVNVQLAMVRIMPLLS